MPNLRFAAPVERRVAIVTGGAQGIGQATALRLAEAGRDVVIADLDATGAAVAAQIESMGQRALFIQTDIADEAAVHAMVNQTHSTFERVDILVCCAGILGIEAEFLAQSSVQFDKVMRINLYGAFFAHQAAIPYMRAQKWGRCLTITSGARFGSADKLPYAVSKGAVYSFVQSLGSAYSGEGVFVNGIEPGRVLTNMVVPRFSAEFLANPGNSIGRYADTNEMAEVIEFLTSERNTYTSGAVWSVNA
jgi:3-oxoacyl-[acyl-carrier protein] reductase